MAEGRPVQHTKPSRSQRPALALRCRMRPFLAHSCIVEFDSSAPAPCASLSPPAAPPPYWKYGVALSQTRPFHACRAWVRPAPGPRPEQAEARHRWRRPACPLGRVSRHLRRKRHHRVRAETARNPRPRRRDEAAPAGKRSAPGACPAPPERPRRDRTRGPRAASLRPARRGHLHPARPVPIRQFRRRRRQIASCRNHNPRLSSTPCARAYSPPSASKNLSSDTSSAPP